MIKMNKITKSYGNINVLDGFSYTFHKSGFVLLFGKSGCGKTTLLNILAGVVEYENGYICYENNVHRKTFSSNNIAYITQDISFIDFLTVKENLELASTDDALINDLLVKFNLIEKINNYPETLSGGEKQRLSIIRALAMEKKIILLDEPTSALDKMNSTNLFEIIKIVSKDVLVVCSSHDKKALDYADDVIDFTKIDSYKTDEQIVEDSTSEKREIQGKRKLQPYFNLWYKRNVAHRKSSIVFLVVLTISIMAISLCDTPRRKYENNVENTYHINQFKYITQTLDDEILNNIRENKNVCEVVLSYAGSVPVEVNYETLQIISDYDLTADTLPFEKKAFPLADRIKYGSYFTDKNQVILSLDKANSIGRPESLIGKTINVELYNKKIDLEIIGVFDEFNEFEKQYFRASNITINESGNYFINSKLTNDFEQDESFFMYGKREYIVYCTSFQKMDEVYNNYYTENNKESFIYADIDGSIKNLFEALFYIVFPFVIMIILVTSLFYYQSQKITFTYSRTIFSELVFLGYANKDIKNSLVRGNLKDITKVFFISMAVAIPIIAFCNMMNSMLYIIPFQIFSFNLLLTVILYIIVCALSITMALFNINAITKSGWYNISIKQRDIL